MSKIKNGGLDQYGAGPFEQQQFGTAGVEGVKLSDPFECNANTALLAYRHWNQKMTPGPVWVPGTISHDQCMSIIPTDVDASSTHTGSQFKSLKSFSMFSEMLTQVRLLSPSVDSSDTSLMADDTYYITWNIGISKVDTVWFSF